MQKRFFKLVPPLDIGGTIVPHITVTEYNVGKGKNHRIAVTAESILAEDEGGDGKMLEPYGTLSVNLPEQPLPDGTFFARDYSYHERVHDAFIAAGLIEEVPGHYGDVGGHGSCTVARLTPKATANPVHYDADGEQIAGAS